MMTFMLVPLFLILFFEKKGIAISCDNNKNRIEKFDPFDPSVCNKLRLNLKEPYRSHDFLLEKLPLKSMLNQKCKDTIMKNTASAAATSANTDWTIIEEHICRHRFINVGGLPHSGTSLINMLLQHTHSGIIAGLKAPVPENEGHHVQNEYPSARTHGSVCGFMKHDSMYITGDNNVYPEITTPKSRRCVYALLAKYWNLTRPLLLEKSPQNIIQLGYREWLFPAVSANILAVRHPLYNCFYKPRFIIDGGNLTWKTADHLRTSLHAWLRTHRYLRDQSLPSISSPTAVITVDHFFNDTLALSKMLSMINSFFPELQVNDDVQHNINVRTRRRLDFHPQKEKNSTQAEPKIDYVMLVKWKRVWNDAVSRQPVEFHQHIKPVFEEFEEEMTQFGYSLFNVDLFDDETFKYAFQLDHDFIRHN